MMISGTGSLIKRVPEYRDRRANAGFTLIEILVVVLIIGITLSLAVLSIGDQQESLIEEEGIRFTALIKLASEEAVMNGEELGLLLSDQTYGFARLEGDGWQPLTEDRQFRQRELPHGMTFELELDGRPVIFDQGEELPLVFILSSGELTPFLLTLQTADEQWAFELNGYFNGQLKTNGPYMTP